MERKKITKNELYVIWNGEKQVVSEIIKKKIIEATTLRYGCWFLIYSTIIRLWLPTANYA